VTGGPARVVFLGSGGFAVPSLYRLLQLDDVDVIGVVTAPDRPAGRGGKVRAVPVALAARNHDLPLLQPPRIRSTDAVEAILALRPDLGVLADYGQIVPQALLEAPRLGILNLHPSLLPRHRGASPIPATILAGDTETGVSLIAMDAGLDTGPLVAQSHAALTGHENGSELEATLAVDAANVLGRAIGPWLRGELEATPQGEDGVTLTRPLRREDGRLDLSRPAADLERQVRALQPWPGSFVETPAGRLVAWQATVDPDENARSGVFGPGPDLRLGTADGWLVLEEVQPAGGRTMAGSDWLRGRPSIAGSTVVPGD
jgi:methionyl-tRNA formyltransferase